MDPTVSTTVKSKFNRHTRPANSRQNSSRSAQLIVNGDGGEGANEHTPFLSHSFENSQGEVLWEDRRPYIRYPAYFLLKLWQTLASNYVNLLLVFVPLGIIGGALGWNPTAVFILNFLAIIPLASLLSFATEELSAKLGQTLGGLLNATFGNAVELIVSNPYYVWGLETYRYDLTTGQHSSSQQQRDPDRTIQYARLHPLQHPLGPRLLFPGRWNKIQSPRVQSDYGFDHGFSDGRVYSVLDYSCNSLRGHEQVGGG